MIREGLGTNPKHINVQLFGTDIDHSAIETARNGLFPASIAADVGDDRLKHHFTKEGDNFRVRKEIRDCAIFSVQDLIKDPPFSRLNLLSCRNLLIYLDREAQKKLLPLFHYTLTPAGVLMLGSSESIGGFSNLFKTLDKKWKIFKRQEVPPALRRLIDFPSGPATPDMTAGMTPPAVPGDSRINIVQLTQRAILDQFAPTAILVDASGTIACSGPYRKIPGNTQRPPPRKTSWI
ncbi:MAG: hypothetical protein KFF68_07470 [Desulfosarcina sp.]|nr:hypothetical protein [Desulfosarcina sp.]